MFKHYDLKTPLELRSLFLNRFNPTLKIICSMLLIALVFIPVPIIFQLSIFVLILGLWISARLPIKKMTTILKTVFIIFFFVILINWLVVKSPGLKLNLERFTLWGSSWSELLKKGWIHQTEIEGINHYWLSGTIWGGWVSSTLSSGLKLDYSSPWYGLSSQVLITSLSMMLKIFCMLTIFSLLVNTTSTIQLTYGFEHFFWPLKWIKVPVTEISYIIATAMRFVPNLFEEANKIMDAQACRGIDFRNGNIFVKIKAVGSIIVPMFAASFNYADKLSDAMEARNFVPGAKRTRYRHFPCRGSNWASFAILIGLLGLFIYLRVCKVIIYPFIAIDCFNI